jgi:hypothetical protein
MFTGIFWPEMAFPKGEGVGFTTFRPMRGLCPHLFPFASVRQGMVMIGKWGRKKGKLLPFIFAHRIAFISRYGLLALNGSYLRFGGAFPGLKIETWATRQYQIWQ